jgi:hypothetical protein
VGRSQDRVEYCLVGRIRETIQILIDSEYCGLSANNIRRSYVVKKLLGLALVMAIAVSAIPYARSVGTPPSPPGVPADNWIPFSDYAGFVVAPADSLPSRDKPPAGTVRGYFVIRQGKSWMRVDSEQEPLSRRI